MSTMLELGYPTGELSAEEEQKVLERVKKIIESGKVAVFTRPHRGCPGMTVQRRVSTFSLDEYGDLPADNGWVAPWDPAYTITEEDANVKPIAELEEVK